MTGRQFVDTSEAMERDQDWLYPAIAFATAAAICAVTLQHITGYPSLPKGKVSLTAALIAIALTALFRFLRYLFRLWRAGEEHPSDRIREQIAPALTAFWPTAAGVVILGAFLHSISFLKSMIPAVIPFWADEAFAATDRAIFVDSQAIALALNPVLVALGLFYSLWHAAHLAGILWVLHWRNGNKARHILSFMLTWSVGMVLAYLFSSMGPIFTGQYDPSIAPESVRRAASFLWANYQANGAQPGGGISAFPSMHVAIAAWLAIVLKDRGLMWLGIAYLMGVFACSVILGWHYVIDGIAGIGVALVADRLAKRWTMHRGQYERAATFPLPASN